MTVRRKTQRSHQTVDLKGVPLRRKVHLLKETSAILDLDLKRPGPEDGPLLQAAENHVPGQRQEEEVVDHQFAIDLDQGHQGGDHLQDHHGLLVVLVDPHQDADLHQDANQEVEVVTSEGDVELVSQAVVAVAAVVEASPKSGHHPLHPATELGN